MLPNDDNQNTHSGLPAPPVTQSAAPPPGTPSRESGTPSREPGTPSRELGGREGPEPTRFGDWELRGRCIDF